GGRTPTRVGGEGGSGSRRARGGTYGMTQLLYSDAIVGFLREFAASTEHRPDILLSFGFVPKVETKLGLIDWLIQDPGNDVVKQEQEYVARLAEMSFEDKKRELVDLYKR